MSKEREAFEAWAYSNKWNIFRVRDMGLDHYVDDFVNGAWHGWQAKAQAVPEGFGDIQSWIAVNSFSALDASMDDFPVVDANELAKYIDSLIEPKQPPSTSDCPDEP